MCIHLSIQLLFTEYSLWSKPCLRCWELSSEEHRNESCPAVFRVGGEEKHNNYTNNCTLQEVLLTLGHMWFSLSTVAKNVVQELTGNSNREEILTLSNTSTDSLLLSLDSFLGVTKHCSPQPEATSVLYFYSVPHFSPPWCLLHSPFPPTSHKTFPGSCKSGRNKLTL